MKRPLLGCLVLAACSVSKHQNLERTMDSSMQVRRSSFTDSAGILRLAGSLTQISEGNRVIIEIVPLGPFSYRPDAGFTGQAEKLTVYGQWQRSETKEDSSATRLISQHRLEQADSTQRGQSHETGRQDLSRKPVPLSTYVMAIIGIGLLGAIARQLVKK